MSFVQFLVRHRSGRWSITSRDLERRFNSHTAAVQKLGLDNEGLGEVLAVVGLYNQMNKLADAYQVEPDILPQH